MNLLELINARAEKLTQMKAFNNENPTMDDATLGKYNALNNEFQQLNRQVSLAEAENILADQVDPLLNGGNLDEAAAQSDYIGAFVNMLQGRQSVEDSLLLAENAVHTGVDSEGGFLVPEEWTKNIFETLKDDSDIRKHITIKQTKTTTNMPIDGDDIEFAWLAELADYPELQPTFGMKQLGAHKAGGVVLISREEIFDSVYNVQKIIENKMRRGITNADDKAFVTGSGTDRPTGIVTATTQEVVTAALGISYKNLVSMKYKVPPQHRKHARWRASDAFLEAVENMLDGNGRPIFTEGSIAKGTPSTLLGFPIDADNNLDNTIALGKTPALFGNFKAYVGADRGMLYVQILREKYATKGAIGILVDKRTDGDLADVKAMAKLTIGA
ncbi:MAG: phage major capsid protein [Arcobacter sp.]|nr:MAG: phage major capsid protein [Arcobacter sp.]